MTAVDSAPWLLLNAHIRSFLISFYYLQTAKLINTLWFTTPVEFMRGWNHKGMVISFETVTFKKNAYLIRSLRLTADESQ